MNSIAVETTYVFVLCRQTLVQIVHYLQSVLLRMLCALILSRNQISIITARKVLNRTRYAITEDLTGLNMKIMNRLRNHDQVRTVWS